MTGTTTADNIQFTVSKVMNVVGIGYIITGNPINGAVKPGAIIKLGDYESNLIIDAIEQIEYAESYNLETALILEDVKVDAMDLFFGIKPGQILTITLPL